MFIKWKKQNFYLPVKISLAFKLVKYIFFHIYNFIMGMKVYKKLNTFICIPEFLLIQMLTVQFINRRFLFWHVRIIYF